MKRKRDILLEEVIIADVIESPLPANALLNQEQPMIIDPVSKLPIIKLFELRLENSQISPQFKLNSLFNEHLSLDDLKKSIRNFEDLINILKLPKLYSSNKSVLLNRIISSLPLPEKGQLGKHPCDEELLKRCIKNYSELEAILNILPKTGNKKPEILLKRMYKYSTHMQNIMDSISAKKAPAQREITSEVILTAGQPYPMYTPMPTVPFHPPSLFLQTQPKLELQHTIA